MLLGKLRAERLVERVRIRPAQHLVLQVRIIDAIEELAEAMDKIAFRDADEDGESHVQPRLNGAQLLGDPRGLLCDLFVGIPNQAVSRDD